MCDSKIGELMAAGEYVSALALLRGSTDPADAVLRIRCKIGDRGYVRLCDRAEILDDFKRSGESRSLVDLLSEYASPDPDVFADEAAEREIDNLRARAESDIRTVIDAVDARGDLGAADLKVLCDAMASIYRDHPLFPDLLVSADMWDVVRFRNYLHTLDVTCSVNGASHTPEALYAALVSLRKDLLVVRDSGCDLAHLSESELSKVTEHGAVVADRKFPLRGLGKLTNRGGHDSVTEEYAAVVENVGGMIREAERMRERIRRAVTVDAWDFRDE